MFVGEGGGEGGDGARVVGSGVPTANVVAAGEVDQGGQEDAVERCATQVALFQQVPAIVAVTGEDQPHRWVGIAPVDATDDLDEVVGGGGRGRCTAKTRRTRRFAKSR